MPSTPSGPQYAPPDPPVLAVKFEIVFEVMVLFVDEVKYMADDVPPVPPEPDHPSDPPLPPVKFEIVFEVMVLFIDKVRYIADDVPPVPPEP